MCSHFSLLQFFKILPILLITADALAHSSVSYLRDCVSRLAIRKYARFPHGDGKFRAP